MNGPSSYRFSAGSWAEGARFLGRDALCQDAARCLLSTDRFDGRRYIGRRRQGKTSMLHRVGAQAEHMLGAAFRDEPPLAVVYVDLRQARTPERLCARIARGLRRVQPPAGLVEQLARAPRPFHLLLDTLHNLADRHRFKLVLLMDEAEALVATPKERTPERLRALEDIALGLHALVEHGAPWLRVFMSSTRRLHLEAHGSLLELLNLFPVAWLGGLQLPVVEDMLRRGGLDDGERQRLHEDCGGHPYLLQVCGYALQRPGVDAETQCRLAMAHDVLHLQVDELAWLRCLAQGRQRAAPRSVDELRRLDYVARQEETWVLREGIFKRWLRSEDHSPVISTNTTSLGVLPAAPALQRGGVDFSLLKAADARAQSFGTLGLGQLPPINLGVQSYTLLHLIARDSAEGGAPRLQEDDLTFPLMLVLSRVGYRFAGLIPRSRISDLRRKVRKLHRQHPSASIPAKWVDGRGGYSLDAHLSVRHNDSPLELDLLAQARSFRRGRGQLLRWLQRARGGALKGERLVLRFAATGHRVLPTHEGALWLLVQRGRGEAPLVKLGPIPLEEAQLAALRYWSACARSERPISPQGYARWAQAEAVVAPGLVTSPCRLIELLGLTGGEFELRGQRASCRWLPAEGSNLAFSLGMEVVPVGIVEAATVEEVAGLGFGGA